MKILLLTILWTLVAASGCMNLELLSELQQWDTGTEDLGNVDIDTDSDSDTDTDSDSDTDSDTDSGNIPIEDTLDKMAPLLIEPVCTLAERLESSICIIEGAGAASFRFKTDEAASVIIDQGGQGSAVVISDEWLFEHYVALDGLITEQEVNINIKIVDINKNDLEVSIIVYGQKGYQVSITEVLADPNGAEPDQEFVEIVNFGKLPVDISNWMIDDNGDYNGDCIAEDTILAPFQAGVIVSGKFNVTDIADPPIDESALIIFLESSIGTGGLKNSEAETIELYDALGNIVSSYNGQSGTPKSGKSACKIFAELPQGDINAWQLESSATPSPGIVPMIN